MLTLWRSVVQFCSAPLVRFPTALDTEASLQSAEVFLDTALATRNELMEGPSVLPPVVN
jgi:hypothetical protein